MNSLTKIKKTALIFAGVILAVIFCTVAATQIILTISATPVNVRCIKWDDTYEEIVSLAERYNNNTLNSSEHAFSFEGTLPSDTPDDYMMITACFEVSNRSYVDKYSANAVITNADKYSENILFTFDANSVVSIWLHRHSRETANVMAYAYVGNLSEDEISELAKGLTVSLAAEGTLFGNRNRSISFKSCNDIVIKDNRELI